MLLWRPLRRLVLPWMLRSARHDKPGVTVVIGVRNRGGIRLRNALSSLRLQDLHRDLVDIVVVDYGSEPQVLEDVQALCHAYDARCVSVPCSSRWNRSHCLNIGIKTAVRQHVLLSDVDMIFPRSYLSQCLASCRRTLNVVYGRLALLPESTNDVALAADPANFERQVRELAEVAELSKYLAHASVLFLRTDVLHYIRGLDESYEGWGFEDLDLSDRLFRLGIKPVVLKTAFLHQWHEPYKGVLDDKFDEIRERNRRRFESKRPVRALSRSWGTVGANSQADGAAVVRT